MSVKKMMLISVILLLITTGYFLNLYLRNYEYDPMGKNQYYANGLFQDLDVSYLSIGIASAMAHRDIQSGRFQHLYYGMHAKGESEAYLESKYHIKFIPIAGCMVNGSTIEAANEYNKIMHSHLKEIYGKDVFKEAETMNRNFHRN